jgi:hypothetical protein
LTIGCCVIELDARPDDAELPDLWHRLRKTVSSKRDRTGRRLHVADSKQVYSTSRRGHGLAELEKSVLAFAGGTEPDFDALLTRVSDDRPAEPWHATFPGETHPSAVDPASVAIAHNALRHDLTEAGISRIDLRAKVMFEGEFNRLCEATRNKAAVLQSATAGLIARVLEAEGPPARIVCDRHGGRSHYGPFLRQMFPDWELTVKREDDAVGEYGLAFGDRRATVIFAEKAETLSLPTAMASMLAKYLRERLMGRFNAWWASHLPDLKPTAGYWTDGLRFLEAIEPARRELGIDARRLRRGR